MRTFIGNAPGPLSFVIAENDEWMLYETPNRFEKGDQFNWSALKLVAKKPRPHKANYWVSWGHQEKRFAKSKDVATLEQHDPKLFHWVRNVMLSQGLT